MNNPARPIVLAAVRDADRYEDLAVSGNLDRAGALAVLLLDDDTVAHRIVVAAADTAEAARVLSDHHESYVGEYLIDLSAPLDVCVRQVCCDTDGITVHPDPMPFDEDHVAFA